jgi:hypothetical protein
MVINKTMFCYLASQKVTPHVRIEYNLAEVRIRGRGNIP